MQAKLENVTADLRAALGGAGHVVGANDGSQPRFELFHASNSICSQQVRATLAQHGTPYLSRQMEIFTGQTYLPSHVRLRMAGCEQVGLPLVTTHSGSTATTFGGCDPAVVPTLLDLDPRQVITDSKRICLHLDAAVDEGRQLRPAHLRDAIDAELDIVDNLPNYQMLMGRPPGEDLRPGKLQRNGDGDLSLSKAERCDRYMAEFAGDAVLIRAYGAKRSKELDAARRLFSPEAMQVAYAKASAACEGLDRKLDAAGTTWLLGPAVTMADLFWALELLRMRSPGAGAAWEGGKLPAVQRFLDAAERLPSIRSAVLDWPGALY